VKDTTKILKDDRVFFKASRNTMKFPCQGWLKAGSQELCLTSEKSAAPLFLSSYLVMEDDTLCLDTKKESNYCVCTVLVSQTSSCHLKQNTVED
jgi:hypothetical protein